MKLAMYTEWLEPGPETDALLKTLAEGAQFKGLRDIPQSERDQMPEGDFAGPNRSFPIQQAVDVGAAAQSLGRAKGNRASIKRRIINIAYRKGDAFVAQLPEDWKKKADQKTAGLIERVLGLFKTRAAQSIDQMTNSDLQQKLFNALCSIEPECVCVEGWFPVTDPAHVVYTVREATGMVEPYGMYPLYDYVLYERAFDLSDSGVVTLNNARIEVEPVTTWEPVEGTSPKAAETKAACTCQSKSATVPAVPVAKEKIMKEATTKVLAAVTPEQEDAIVAFAANGFKATEVVREVTKEVVKEVPGAPVELTREQAIEKFGLGDAVKVAADKRAASVKTLKDSGRCTITDEKLNAMSQDELDGLVKLMGDVKAPTNKVAQVAHVRTAATQVEGADDAAIPAGASLDDKIKAARAAKK